MAIYPFHDIRPNMHDLLRRLIDALPLMERWMDALQADHLDHSVAASELGVRRLFDHFSAPALDHTRVATVSEIPFPPVAEFGVPEFAPSTPMAGITFGNMYFVRPKVSEGVHVHELVHVVQWNALGVSDFLLTYAVGLIEHGYAHSPLEAIAFRLQERFERTALRGLVHDEVARHAAATRDAAAALFNAHGLTMIRRDA